MNSTLNRAADLTALALEYRPEHDDRRIAEPELADHTNQLLAMFQTHFESAKPDSPSYRAWDKHDTRAYGQVVFFLSKSQCKELLDELRRRHHWRPSVAQVREAVEALYGAPAPALTGAEAAMRTVHSMPRALPSAANGPGREQARREHQRRRAAAGLAPLRKPENQAPASLPASLVGFLVTALVDGRDARGIVFQETEDAVRVKFSDMHYEWVDKSRVRREVPRDL